jgi:nitrite reductase/ring-hydroxylating ferredoxin subunit
MGPLSAQLLDELGYDPDDGLPALAHAGEAVALSGAARPGALVAARIGARRVAIARLGSGRLIIVDDECPHDGGRISDGFVDGERLVCARHGWELEARHGRCERVCKLRE